MPVKTILSFFNKNLVEITLPESVERIGSSRDLCFGKDLEKINMPKALKYVGSEAFMYSSLKQVTMLKNVKYEEKSFQYCKKLEDVTIEDGVLYIPEFCFQETDIRKIVIPASVKIIDELAFLGCQALTEVIFESPETMVAKNAFNVCPSLTLACQAEIKKHTVDRLPEDLRLELIRKKY